MYFKGESFTFADNRFQLAIGGKYVASNFHFSLGGGGANVAIGAARHGVKSAVLGKIGNNPFKKIILDNLQEKKVSIQLCQIDDDYINISSILLTKKGERTIVHYVSPHQHILDNKSYHQLIEAKMVYLGNLPDVSLSEKTELLHYLKKLNILTVVNLGVQDCRRKKDQLEKMLKFVDILIVNGHEFADLVKAPYKDIHFQENIIRWYIPYLSSKILIITEGEKGSFGYCSGRVFHQKAIRCDKIIDTTGAGDAYTAGFISEYLKSRQIEKAMEKGTKYAAKILNKIGAN